MRSFLAAICLLGGCSFPTDGVLGQGAPPDAEVGAPDAEPVPDASVVPDAGPCDGLTLGVACDGPDGDLCNEGVTVCSSDGMTAECDDATDTILESCNTLDDDCDGTPDDGFDLTMDESNCGTCGNTCTNTLGTTSCQPPGTCTPACSNGAADCDADPDDGCELQDTNPLCTGANVTPDITVNGDLTGTPVVFNGTTERVLRIHLVESQMGGATTNIALTATIALTSGVGATYHLAVYCPSCGSVPMAGIGDSVGVGRDDAAGDRSFDVFAAINYDTLTPSTTCAQWTLTVTGNSGSINRCGN